MLHHLKEYVKSLPFLRGMLYGSYPGSWLYDRQVIKWMTDTPLGRQLPFLYQIFRIYAYLYFKLFNGTQLIGGRELFSFLSSLFVWWSKQDFLKISLAEYEVFLNPIDVRFFQVVNELNSEDSDVRVLHSLLSEGDSFIDVGANHGSFSIVASKLVGTTGFVTSIEPQPRLAKLVNKSLALNALCNFQVHQIAVGEFDGEIELLVPQDTSGSAGIYPEHSGTHNHNILKVPVKRFDDLMDWRTLPGKLLVKLDVEGSEIAFLTGARQMIISRRPKLILEIHPGTLRAAGKTGDELKSLLQSLGYSKYSTMINPEKTYSIEDLNTTSQRNLVLSMN